MSTTYLSGTVIAQLDQAQLTVDSHVYTRVGFCVACGELAPCATLVAASATFARYRQLPQRRPGLALRGAAP